MASHWKGMSYVLKLFLRHKTKDEIYSLSPDHYTSLQSQHSEVLQTIEDQKNLIGQLESDLLQAQPDIPQRTEQEVHVQINTLDF